MYLNTKLEVIFAYLSACLFVCMSDHNNNNNNNDHVSP